MPVTLTHPTNGAITVTFSPNLGGYTPSLNLRTAIAGRNQAGVQNIQGRAGGRWRQWEIEAVMTAAQLAIVDQLITAQDDAMADAEAFNILYTDMKGTQYNAKVEPVEGQHGVYLRPTPAGELYTCAIVVTELL